MTVHIATEPNDYAPESLENKIFESFKTKLPEEEDYYIFHSFRVTNVINNILREKEIDFVVFNPKKGIICIEAKAGAVYTAKNSKGHLSWFYANGEEIKKGGPYRQAESKKRSLLDRFDKINCSYLRDNCKIIQAVWFVSLTNEQFSNRRLTPEADKALTLTKEDLENPGAALDRIYNIKYDTKIETKLQKIDEKNILENILCPEFNFVSSMVSEVSDKKRAMVQLLNEQVNILNFLEEQPQATINGSGGTGKTMIALEKAKRHAQNGDKVLFLCFNKELCKYLRNNKQIENVDFYNIDAFACSYCKTKYSDYSLLREKITTDFVNQNFPYKHIIIDEGQDFGQNEIEKNNILFTLRDIVIDSEKNCGSFYVFYDKQQFIQGAVCPKYIEESDCQLILTKNCRNTQNIAETSIRPLKSNKKSPNIKGAIKGDDVILYIAQNKEQQINYLNSAIKFCLDKKLEDIVIVSVKTKEEIEKGNTILSEFGDTYPIYRKTFKITNCTDFKGLEADAVVLVDVDCDTFINSRNCNRFYVGASRAKLNLYIICNMSKEDCIYSTALIKEKKEYMNRKSVLDNAKTKDAEKRFAAVLNAIWKE